jgi:Sec-independent protein translocase protein TatA
VTRRLQKKSRRAPTIAPVRLAFIGNIGMLELVLIVVIAVLIFGKDLPHAASKAYLQARKLRNAVDDLRRESGIDRELREIERTVREAEWEARRTDAPSPRPTERRAPAPEPPALPATPAPPPWEASDAAPPSDAAQEPPRDDERASGSAPEA